MIEFCKDIDAFGHNFYFVDTSRDREILLFGYHNINNFCDVRHFLETVQEGVFDRDYIMKFLRLIPMSEMTYEEFLDCESIRKGISG